MGDNTSKNCYRKNNLELTFARRRWGSNTRKCRRAQSIKKEWEASDVGEKERKQSVDWEERKKERRKGTRGGVCVFVFLRFPSQRAAAPSKPGASCGPWSANPAVLPATGTATGAEGEPMFGRVGRCVCGWEGG